MKLMKMKTVFEMKRLLHLKTVIESNTNGREKKDSKKMNTA